MIKLRLFHKTTCTCGYNRYITYVYMYYPKKSYPSPTMASFLGSVHSPKTTTVLSLPKPSRREGIGTKRRSPIFILDLSLGNYPIVPRPALAWPSEAHLRRDNVGMDAACIQWRWSLAALYCLTVDVSVSVSSRAGAGFNHTRKAFRPLILRLTPTSPAELASQLPFPLWEDHWEGNGRRGGKCCWCIFCCGMLKNSASVPEALLERIILLFS